jgi:hypothetical protein
VFCASQQRSFARKGLWPALPAMLSEPQGGLRHKSTVYGLNGQRVYFVIALSLATYGHAI